MHRGTVLELNGYDVVFGDDDAFDLVMAASQSQQDVDALAARIAENIRPRE